MTKKTFLSLLIAAVLLSGTAKSFADGPVPKVGISLSGGAALGYAHIGFLQAMDEAGIRPDCIAGTSMGAIIGMMYAAGYAPREILQIVRKEHMNRLSGIYHFELRHKGGLMSTRHLQKVLSAYVPHNHFDSLPIRFYCCTFDMDHLQPIYRSRGEQLVQYVTASAAMPGVFAPPLLDSVHCVDGGMYDNLPVLPLQEEGCDIRIASYLLIERPSETTNAKKLWMHAYSYCTYSTALPRLEQFTDVATIDPYPYWLTDFKKAEELYELGYRYGKQFFETFSTHPNQP